MAQPNTIDVIRFHVLGSQENTDDSHAIVTHKELFKLDLPLSAGPYDAGMGTTDKLWNCSTCLNHKTMCDGHYGSMPLSTYVKSPIFKKQLLKWLKIICFNCYNVIVKKKITAPKEQLLSEYVKSARTDPKCFHCGTIHPSVQENKIEPGMFYIEENERKTEIFNHEIAKIMNGITDQTVLDMGKPLECHPNKFVLNVIRIPPNTARPDDRSARGGRSTNSDLTVFTKNMIEQNSILPKIIPKRGEMPPELRDMYYAIDALYHAMIKGNTGTNNNQLRLSTSTNNQPNSLASRHPKKSGSYRKNIGGKRSKYIFRSVITGDNLVKIDELGIPMEVATSMSIPEIVRLDNIDRLNIYFNNRDKVYPGCVGIINGQEKQQYNIKYLSEDYKLRLGDTVFRHLIDGDIVNFNRQPSLTFSSISSHRVVVLKQGQTIRMNVSACVLYNADFDGDEMNAMVPRNIMSRNEVATLSHVSQWYISYKHNTPLIGCFQDSTIGMAELSTNGVVFNKWHAMQLFSHIDLPGIEFTKQSYTGRDLISMILPQINIRNRKPKFYMSQYAGLIDYDPEDISVNIDRGVLKSGILDKNTIGQEIPGTIFHIIASEYGPKKALETVFHCIQLASQFFIHKGFTASIRDTVISEQAKEEIDISRNKMFLESQAITKKLNDGKLTPPIGTSLSEFYEMKQLNALQVGDEFIETILKDTDMKTNGIGKLIMFGSKGKPLNFININADIGQPTIAGGRPDALFAWGRTSPYFFRYDTSPHAKGYISTSYKEGIRPEVYAFTASEARHGLISGALSTGVTGYQNRLAVKCMESILANNNRSSAKMQSLIQPLYAESGIDPRRTESVVFPSIMISLKEFELKYKANVGDFDTRYKNKNVQTILDAEYKQILDDRTEFRKIFLDMSDKSPKHYVINNRHTVPINTHRIISDTIYNYRDEVSELSKDEKVFDPVYCIQEVEKLCLEIAYAHFNENWLVNKRPIPEYIQKSLFILRVLFRSTLSSLRLRLMGVNNKLLDIIIAKIKITFKNSLIGYGASIGTIAAQCFSEPLTQYVLNSKHRAGGGGGTKTDTINRVMEILGARSTEKMKNPSMILFVSEQHETNKFKVQEIANHIEMMDLERFIKSVRVFFETYGKPVHSLYKHEEKMIRHFEKYSGIVAPANLVKWCIRIELIREKLITNSMKLETIILVLKKKYPHTHIVYTPENTSQIIIRIYMGSNMIKPTITQTQQSVVMDFMHTLRETVIRGIKDVNYATVIDIARPRIKPDGGISNTTVYGIHTAGSNMESIMNNKYIDAYRSQCDSIIEFQEIYGVAAARNKIIDELTKEIDVNRVHTSVYADEMTFTGEATSIQKSGMQKREMGNVALRLTFQSPIQVSEDASANGYVNKVSGNSGPLVMGGVVQLGTQYNKVIVSTTEVDKLTDNFMKAIDDEL